MGDRRATLDAALERLANHGAISVLAVSSMREYPAWGPIEQPAYLNAAAQLATSLSPQALLSAMLEIERALGRDRAREQRWGPRTLDLDLLLYGQLVLSEPGLRLPHPWIATRRFVLEPLAELAPQLTIPPGGRRVVDLLAELDHGAPA